MRILLFNPPISNVNLTAQYAPEDLRYQITKSSAVGPPHALCSLAGNLRDFEVEIYDLKAEYCLGLELELEQAVEKKLEDFKPDIIGVTVMTSAYNYAVRILKTVKKYDKNILTIAGGIHPSLCPQDFEGNSTDVVIIGQGKKIFRDVVLHHMNKESFSEIPCLAVWHNDKFHYTKKVNLFKTPEDLLSTVHANRELVEKYKDAYRIGPNRATNGYIETSLGCTNKCTFCSVWPMNRSSYYTRDLEDIICELKTMDDYEVVRFVDANTTGDEKHIEKVFDRIIQEDIRHAFMMDIRADTIVRNEDLIKKAVEAGLRIAMVGIETVDEDELEEYNKESSLYTNIKAIEILHKYNIMIRASFIIQQHYEEENFKKIDKFVKENNLTLSAFGVMTPLPGTVTYSQCKDKITIKDLDYYNFFNSVMPTKLPEKEFYRNVAELFRGQAMVRYEK